MYVLTRFLTIFSISMSHFYSLQVVSGTISGMIILQIMYEVREVHLASLKQFDSCSVRIFIVNTGLFYSGLLQKFYWLLCWFHSFRAQLLIIKIIKSALPPSREPHRSTILQLTGRMTVRRYNVIIIIIINIIIINKLHQVY